jgi:methyl-accepting chemotaxis protein
MDMLNNLSINKRLLIGFSVVTALMVVLTLVGIYRVNMIASTLTTMTDINVVKQRHGINLRGSVHDRAIAIRDLAIATSAKDIKTHIDDINRLAAFYQSSHQAIEGMIRLSGMFSDQELALIQQLDDIEGKTEALIQAVIATKTGLSNKDPLVLLQTGGGQLFVDWLGSINAFIDVQEDKNITATSELLTNAATFKTTMLVLTLSALVLSVLVAYWIANSLKASLGAEPTDAAEVLKQIAQGNLRTPINTKYQHSMLATMARMQERLRQTVLEIVAAAQGLKAQSTAVANSSSDIVDLAHEQDQLTVSTRINLDEIKTNIVLVSETAAKNKGNAKRMVERASNGLESMSLSVAAMQNVSETVTQAVSQISKLEELTSQIGGITNVINSISDQTNLLALNAAIEAARAGETGRGFAVVADEVRQLALRTGEATSEIQSTIEEVQKETSTAVSVMQDTLPKVEDGQTKTQNAMNLLQEIENKANDSYNNASLNSDTSARQVTAISAITDVMATIDGINKKTVSSLEQNKDATLALDALAEKLNNEVGFFKITK